MASTVPEASYLNLYGPWGHQGNPWLRWSSGDDTVLYGERETGLRSNAEHICAAGAFLLFSSFPEVLKDLYQVQIW